MKCFRERYMQKHVNKNLKTLIQMFQSGVKTWYLRNMKEKYLVIKINERYYRENISQKKRKRRRRKIYKFQRGKSFLKKG